MTMAFDDSTGASDWRRHHTTESEWGDDFGDRSPASLFSADLTARERERADLIPRVLYQLRQAQLVKDLADDAKMARAPGLLALKERAEKKRQRGTFGQVLAKEMHKAHQRDKKR
jgi:hypothetical protein